MFVVFLVFYLCSLAIDSDECFTKKLAEVLVVAYSYHVFDAVVDIGRVLQLSLIHI